MKNKIFISFFTILLIIGIANIVIASSDISPIKSFDEVAADYNMTPEELQAAIESGVTPEELEYRKNLTDTTGAASMSDMITGSIVTICIVLVITIPIYLIPTIVACKSKHPNKLAIILINIFLGWSLIGWVGALIWACIKPTEKVNGNKYESLSNLQKLKESGAISEDEFNQEKEKLLK